MYGRSNSRYPSEELITSAPIASTHSAAATQLSSSTGVSLRASSVTARMKLAPKAGPISCPSRMPPTTDSVFVPWEVKLLERTLSAPVTKSCSATICIRANVSCVRFGKPASKTATITPSPVRPRSCSSVTRICESCSTAER